MGDDSMNICDFTPKSSDDGLYFRTVGRKLSGESIETRQLAEAAGGEVVYHIPQNGTLVYQVQLVIDDGEQVRRELPALLSRKGKTVWIIGALRPWDELGSCRPIFEAMRRSSNIFFARSHEQCRYLKEYGIDAPYLSVNERAYTPSGYAVPNSVVYSGFVWPEKLTSLFLDVAELMPDWKFTLHVGMNTASLRVASQPENVTMDGRFLDWEEHMKLLSSHKYVWLPRTDSRWVYAGRSGVTAVASGSVAVLPDVGPNDEIPGNVAMKYDKRMTAAQIAQMLKSPTWSRDREAVNEFLDSVSPVTAWKTISSYL